jgi:hypothetical protein
MGVKGRNIRIIPADGREFPRATFLVAGDVSSKLTSNLTALIGGMIMPHYERPFNGVACLFVKPDGKDAFKAATPEEIDALLDNAHQKIDKNPGKYKISESAKR